MNEIKVIKNKEDYENALKMIEVLMEHDPDPESEEGEKLNLLSTLIEDYESKMFPETLPDPIDAIKFRMEQNNLKPSDLIPYIGSRGRVSEILSGKRKLTIEMMRSLESGLGIPAKVLLKKPTEDGDFQSEGWSNQLLKEMEKRGYFEGESINGVNKLEIIRNFFSPVNYSTKFAGMLRQSSYRTSSFTDKNALAAWSTFVFKKASLVKVSTKYIDGTVNLSFMQKLAKLSVEKNGPLLAKDYLEKCGIILIIEPHFSRTYLDGAVLLENKDNPVIGLTLRYDRLDNFWFTLMHELAHISLHFNDDCNYFYDEIENSGAIIDEKEKEADNLAGEALVPNAKWEKSPAKRVPSPVAALALSKDLGINIVIVAGTIMHKHKRYYSELNKITNSSKVREYFEDINWQK